MNWFLNTDRKLFPKAPESSFAHQGAGPNIIFVDPEHDLVVVVRWIRDDVAAEFLGKVVASVTGPKRIQTDRGEQSFRRRGAQRTLKRLVGRPFWAAAGLPAGFGLLRGIVGPGHQRSCQQFSSSLLPAPALHRQNSRTSGSLFDFSSAPGKAPAKDSRASRAFSGSINSL